MTLRYIAWAFFIAGIITWLICGPNFITPALMILGIAFELGHKWRRKRSADEGKET